MRTLLLASTAMLGLILPALAFAEDFTPDGNPAVTGNRSILTAPDAAGNVGRIQHALGAVEVIPDTAFKDGPAPAIIDKIFITPGIAVQPRLTVSLILPNIEDAQASNATTVDSVVVTSTRYQADAQTTGTKTNTPLLETPMAVQVVPRDVIDDRQIRTEIDAVKNVSGVQAPIYQFYDAFLIRGFDSGYGATYRNGLQMRGINEAVNAAFIDHVEVVKGPTSMLYGRVEPGGFVNVVTKTPQEKAAYSAELQAGSWGFVRGTVDATGKLSADGTLTYRLIGDIDQSHSFIANARRDNKAASGTLSWQPNNRFNARLDLEYYDYASTWLDAPVPVIGSAPANVPRSFSILLRRKVFTVIYL